MTDSRNEATRRHEDGLVLFVSPVQRPRFRDALAETNAVSRSVYVQKLAHFAHLDERFATPITETTPHAIYLLLKGKGAPDECHVVSEDPDLDGMAVPLAAAIEELDCGTGALISCIPGRLALFLGEHERARYLLERPA